MEEGRRKEEGGREGRSLGEGRGKMKWQNIQAKHFLEYKEIDILLLKFHVPTSSRKIGRNLDEREWISLVRCSQNYKNHDIPRVVQKFHH